MNKISCAVIKDLMPLYFDEVCSDDSKKMVEEHLAGCGSCNNELTRIKCAVIIPIEAAEKNINEGNAIKEIAAFWEHSKVKAFTKGLVIAIALCAAAFFGYLGLFKWNIISVPSNVVEITDVCQLADGRIAYHVKLTDGYSLNECSFEANEDGNFYVIPKRPIIKTKIKWHPGLANMYYSLGEVEKSAYRDKYGADAKIKALYYGTPEDNILIWQEGMELPKASEKVEAELILHD